MQGNAEKTLWGHMKQLFEDQAWKKTLQLIEEKYGKSLQFRSLKLMNDQKKSAYQQGDDFIIPLSLREFDLGNVIVSRGSFLDEQQKSEIVDLIKFLLEPQVYNLHLKNTEEIILNQKNNRTKKASEVIDLYASKENEATRRPLSQIIHLKSLVPQIRLKVALKIHDMSRRNLFVRLNDVIHAESTVEDLLSLNDTTVFIEDVKTVGPAQLKIIEEFLSQTTVLGHDSGLLVLVGSSLTLEAIETESWNLRLKNDLMGFYFDIDRVPMNQQTSEEILDLLFFELNQPMA